MISKVNVYDTIPTYTSWSSRVCFEQMKQLEVEGELSIVTMEI